MMPEVIAGWLFPRRRWENNLTAYRVLCGVGVVANLMMMMMANLVGFAVGVDGLKSIIAGIFRDYSGMSIFVAEDYGLERLTQL
jgi:D-alanyl-lipoteichoic acid acyltransferase DltB (MBOAT superfamily)